MMNLDIKDVIENDYCIGCGVCASLSENFSIVETKNKMLKANLNNQNLNEDYLKEISSVCPFSDYSLNEDELGKEIFSNKSLYDNSLGYYLKTYVGHVSKNNFRESGSSGGVGKWILAELFEKNYVDKVIQVKENNVNSPKEPLYSFAVYEDLEQIKEGSKSAYYPIEMSEILSYIKENEGRYAISGVPCFIKSLRLLAKKDPVIRERLKFHLGLVCGHLKSKNYAKMIAWQMGVDPDDLSQFDFRKKNVGTKANHKGVKAKKISDESFYKEGIVQEYFGTNYGHGFFKYKACDYCDDVVSETADISIGDAWLPGYLEDNKGDNIIIIRNEKIKEIFEKARLKGELNIKDIDTADVKASQDAGLRHRRDGLSYRLYLQDKKNLPRPIKRVEASKNILTKKYKKIHKMRMKLRIKSHKAFEKAIEKNNFNYFYRVMKIKIFHYNLINRGIANYCKDKLFK